ncbi:MAG TPA: HNH endonuclease signature motif containing protein [Methanocorpusculum sp.]|nr:HNH endonuclease signature motif containing protein [Methanocorpusculum sp.]
MKFQKSDFVQNTDFSDVVFPSPCTTAAEERNGNPEMSVLCADIDSTVFNVALDILINQVMKSGQLDADKYHGVIYNPVTGKILKPSEKKNGYLYVTLWLHPSNHKINIPVHRFVYYAAHPETPIGSEFDIHHIDGNKKNNCWTNLERVPRKYHSLIGACKNAFEAEECYLRFIRMNKHGSNVDAYSIKALRVCVNQLPRCSNRRGIINAFFAEKMNVSYNYCLKLCSSMRGTSVMPATPEEEAQILKEYAWLIEKANAGRRVRKNKNAAEEC